MIRAGTSLGWFHCNLCNRPLGAVLSSCCPAFCFPELEVLLFLELLLTVLLPLDIPPTIARIQLACSLSLPFPGRGAESIPHGANITYVLEVVFGTSSFLTEHDSSLGSGSRPPTERIRKLPLSIYTSSCSTPIAVYGPPAPRWDGCVAKRNIHHGAFSRKMFCGDARFEVHEPRHVW